ncbi:hypothetical protein LINGRAHAP2_LOCUS2963, partial [Linum grandiflorum]
KKKKGTNFYFTRKNHLHFSSEPKKNLWGILTNGIEKRKVINRINKCSTAFLHMNAPLIIPETSDPTTTDKRTENLDSNEEEEEEVGMDPNAIGEVGAEEESAKASPLEGG